MLGRVRVALEILLKNVLYMLSFPRHRPGVVVSLNPVQPLTEHKMNSK